MADKKTVDGVITLEKSSPPKVSEEERASWSKPMRDFYDQAEEEALEESKKEMENTWEEVIVNIPGQQNEPSIWEYITTDAIKFVEDLKIDAQNAVKNLSPNIDKIDTQENTEEKSIDATIPQLKQIAIKPEEAKGFKAPEFKPKKIAVKPEEAKGFKAPKVFLPKDLEKELTSITTDEGVNLDIFKSIVYNESRGTDFSMSTVSPKGATGIAQIMPATARSIAKLFPNKFIGKNVDEKTKNILTNRPDNLRAMILLWKDDRKRFVKQGVDEPDKFATAKYNASTKAFNKARNTKGINPNIFSEIFPYLPTETQTYISNIFE